MIQRIAIFGAGGFGREVLQLIRDINAVQPAWDCAGFLADSGLAPQADVAGLPVLGSIDWLGAHPDVHVVVAIGAPAGRLQVTQRIRAGCANPFASLVHPRAWLGDRVALGEGAVICAGALVTTDIRIGQHVHVNIGCTIGHDALIDDFASLNPGVNISGRVHVHEGSEVGTGSVVIPGCAIGPWSIVGAGTVVTGAVKANCTVVGAPARIVRERPEGWQYA